MKSLQNEALRISSNNIVASDGRTLASLTLSKTGQIIGQADEIQLSDKHGETQLMINENQFFSKIEKVTINSEYHSVLLRDSVSLSNKTRMQMNFISSYDHHFLSDFSFPTPSR